MAEEWAALDAQSQLIQAQNYRLALDQNASNEVMRRKYRSRLPPVFEGLNLFNTPGAGASNPAVVNRTEAPRTAPDQPRLTEPPRRTDDPPPHVAAPPDHFPRPLDNMLAAASRLAAIPMEGDSLAAIETRRARDLLQTAMVQQQAYSYSRDRIHSTPRPSKSYSRHMDEPEVSSSARCRNAAHGEINAQDVVDNGRA